MYFAIGIPNSLLQVLEVGERIICNQLASDGKFLIILTNRNIFLWSSDTSPTLLGRTNLRRKDENLYFKSVICSPDAKHIATINQAGKIELFSITAMNTLYQLHNKNKQPIKTTLEKKKQLSIEYVRQVTTVIDITSFTTHTNQILAVSSHCIFYLINWNFDIILFKSSIFQLLQPISILENKDSLQGFGHNEEVDVYEQNLAKEMNVKQIECCNKYIGFVFKNGKVAILILPNTFTNFEGDIDIDVSFLQSLLTLSDSKETVNDEDATNEEIQEKKGEDQLKSQIINHRHPAFKKGEWIVEVGGKVISFSRRHNLLAIGHTSGEISIFQHNSDKDIENMYFKPSIFNPKNDKLENFEILRIFSLIHWGITPDNTGYVNSLQWSPDGNVLAVGWKDRGISLWSIHGCRLMCSIPQLEGCKEKHNSDDHIPPSPRSKKVELLRDGVKSLCWGVDGYSLIITSKPKSIPNAAEVMPSMQLTNCESQSLVQISFAKSSLAIKSPNLFYSRRLILQGSDRLYLLEKRRKDIENIQWSQLPIHSEYIHDNWPIQLVAVNRVGMDLAVAGLRGFTIFDNISKSWRIFNDRKKEQSIQCTAMCWYKHCIIVASQLPNGSCELLAFNSDNLSFNSLLLKYPIDQMKKPIMMDCNDQHLIYYTSESFFYHFLITEVTSTSSNPPVVNAISQLKLTLLHQTSFNEGNLLSFLILPPNTTPAISPSPHGAIDDDINDTNGDHHHNHGFHHKQNHHHNNTPQLTTPPVYYVTLNERGNLSLLSMGETTEIHLSSNVEQFWFGGNIMLNNHRHHVDFQLSNSLWAYGEGGLQVWFPFFQNSNSPFFLSSPFHSGGNVDLNQPTNLNINDINHSSPNSHHNNNNNNNNNNKDKSNGNHQINSKINGEEEEAEIASGNSSMQLINDKSLEFDLEVYPVGFIDDLGIVIGISQGVSYSTSQYPTFEIKTKTHPFLHSILRHLINKGQVEYALEIAKRHSYIPHFTHSLEFLLHEAVDNASSHPSNFKPYYDTLVKVIDFLKSFQEYPQVVVSCVRKTDPRLWPMILKLTGSPRSLFQQCLSREPFSFLAAASFLRVIYLVDGVDTARKLGFVLLEAILKSNQLSLLPDLMRFLEPNQSSSSSQSPHASSPSGGGSIFTPAPKNSFIIDDERYKQEMIFSRFVRRLIQQKDMLTLCVFRQRVGREIRSWLYREHKDSALLSASSQFVDAFKTIHRQFNIPFSASHSNITLDRPIFDKLTVNSINIASSNILNSPHLPHNNNNNNVNHSPRNHNSNINSSSNITPPSSPSPQSSPSPSPPSHSMQNNNINLQTPKSMMGSPFGGSRLTSPRDSPISFEIYYPQPPEVDEDILYFSKFAAPLSSDVSVSSPQNSNDHHHPSSSGGGHNFGGINVSPRALSPLNMAGVVPPLPDNIYLPSMNALKDKPQDTPVVLKSSIGVVFTRSAEMSNQHGSSNVPPASLKQLEIMLEEMYYSHCFDFVIVISAVISNYNLLFDVLSERGDCWRVLCESLLKLPGSGYKELHDVIVKYFSKGDK